MLTVDLGCAGAPFELADIFVDVDKRYTNFYKGKCFVVADIEALPFKDKAFHFVWCAHVLEHVSDPIAACREIQRVGTEGRINVPTFFREFLHPDSAHRWIVSPRRKGLVFERKPSILASPKWVDAMRLRAVQCSKHVLLSRFHRIEFDWQDDFEVEVCDESLV